MIKIKSLIASVHDTSYGGYPYKVIAIIELPVKDFNKLCPKIGPSRQTLLGRRPALRDLGNLVTLVNNAVYIWNKDIPAYNPSIDSNGDKRTKEGIKTLEFVYFFNDVNKAKALGFEHHRDGTTVKYGQHSINLLKESI